MTRDYDLKDLECYRGEPRRADLAETPPVADDEDVDCECPCGADQGTWTWPDAALEDEQREADVDFHRFFRWVFFVWVGVLAVETLARAGHCLAAHLAGWLSKP